MILEQVTLQRLRAQDRDALFALVDGNRTFLREWLPWVDSTTSVDETAKFLSAIEEEYSAGRSVHFGITHREQLLGVCGFHRIDACTRVGEVGYWLAQSNTGQGVMTHALNLLAYRGFTRHRLHRIEVSCAVDNHKSRAVPERLGFRLDKHLHQREDLHGRPIDHVLYVLLADEYPYDQ
ncbi:GNAT family N-acetyltransferase [Marinimicrobium alkaliphilum]|uniref:GNAT family N-acetyltransferase n=1 Tax=Marinimicrobium alkaliphilum TaxID=2202654 RepID=UPI0013001FEE|nr:GNAT family protein [Marinimicrobium alkaliphilum]